jgi:hypothetical protein
MAAAFHNCSTLIQGYEENDRELIYQIIEQTVDKDLLAMGAKYLVRKEQLARMVDESKETLMRLKDAMDYIGLDKSLMAPLLDLLEGPITVKWFYKHNCHPENISTYKGWYMDDAVVNGACNIVKWLRTNGYPWGEDTCAYAANRGHLEILQWARANGCPWGARTCAAATEKGHLEILKWVRANGCPWDSYTCANAAKGGHLEILQWARANGCPWDQWTCAYAALGGHLEILQWARANGCPWDLWTTYYAADSHHMEILVWARANGCPG